MPTRATFVFTPLELDHTVGANETTEALNQEDRVLSA